MLRYALTPVPRLTRAEYVAKAGEANPHLKQWLDSLDANHHLRDTVLTRADGIRLHAYLLDAPCPTQRTVVLVHGYTCHGLQELPLAQLYHDSLKFNVLLPDLYAHGLSEGKVIQMGWKDRHDVRRWTEIAHAQYASDSIYVHGVSMGAATTMMLSGDSLPTYVRVFVDDCGYTSVWEEFRGELKARFHLPPFPVLHAANLLCKCRYGWSFRAASAKKQVAKCHRPMLFIHGDADTFVPTWMVYELEKAKPAPKQLWVVPKTKHACSYHNAPAEYYRRLRNFLLSE